MRYSFEKLAEVIQFSSLGAITEDQFEEIVSDLSSDPTVTFTSGCKDDIFVVKKDGKRIELKVA